MTATKQMWVCWPMSRIYNWERCMRHRYDEDHQPLGKFLPEGHQGCGWARIDMLAVDRNMLARDEWVQLALEGMEG